MKCLEFISVRDSNTKDFVKKITGRDTELNVDPVFITNFDEYITSVKKRKPYLLVYAYANRITDTKEIASIKAYAKKKGLVRVLFLCVILVVFSFSFEVCFWMCTCWANFWSIFA